jgi:hypothetical protein
MGAGFDLIRLAILSSDPGHQEGINGPPDQRSDRRTGFLGELPELLELVLAEKDTGPDQLPLLHLTTLLVSVFTSRSACLYLIRPAPLHEIHHLDTHRYAPIA